MNTKLIFQTVIGAAGYGAWALMAYLDPAQRPDFLHFNIAMAMGTIGLVLRDMRASADPAAPPTDKQAGRAHAGLLALLAAGSLLLAACATHGQSPDEAKQAAQAQYTQACATWGATFGTALQLRKAGKLNKAQVEQITILDSQVTPLCMGQMPPDADSAAQKVTAAVTAIAIIEAATKGEKQ